MTEWQVGQGKNDDDNDDDEKKKKHGKKIYSDDMKQRMIQIYFLYVLVLVAN